MDISVKPGTYVVAVSGGVDSMSLLHLLAQQLRPINSGKKFIVDTKLIVAHFDHGIRADSVLDRKLVQETAQNYGLQFVYDEGRLGLDVSEERAREARYTFLRRVQQAANADAIITAHHWDDAIETAVINLVRGTNRRGLSALRSKSGLLRPLIDAHVSKAQIAQYAREHNLVWREDSTNQDSRYLRNYIRNDILSRFDDGATQKLSTIIRDVALINEEIDVLVDSIIKSQMTHQELDRQKFIALPHIIAREVLIAWVRGIGTISVDSYAIERLVVACKTLSPGRRVDVKNEWYIRVKKYTLALNSPDR